MRASTLAHPLPHCAGAVHIIRWALVVREAQCILCPIRSDELCGSAGTLPHLGGKVSPSNQSIWSRTGIRVCEHGLEGFICSAPPFSAALSERRLREAQPS